MEYNLKEVVEWLVTNKYITIHKGKPKFTSTYHKEITGIEKGLTSIGIVREILPVQTSENFNVLKINSYTLADWSRYYQEFISACKIPQRIQGTHGDSYAVNKYSEDGMKAFKKAMTDGYRLEVLILAVTLYYQSSIRLKKAIGNYMSSGEWKSDYELLLEKGKEGNLAAHIKEETKQNGTTKYDWG